MSESDAPKTGAANETEKRIIVSFTSYPARIGMLEPMLQSIFGQTRKADEFILWLASEQFPNAEKELPANLLKHMEEGRLTVR